MAGSSECLNRRQFLAASVFFLSGCIDTGSDTPPTTLDDFEMVDSSQVPTSPTVTAVESKESQTTVTVKGRIWGGSPCTELFVEMNPHLSADGETVFVDLGTRETDESCAEEMQRLGFRLVFTVRDIHPETVFMMVRAVSSNSYRMEIPYPENQTGTTTT